MLWERGRIVMDDGGDDDFTFAAAHAQPPPRLLSAGGDGGSGFMGPPLMYPVFGRPRSPPRLYPVFGRPRSPPRPALEPEPEPETPTAGVPLRQLLLLDKDKDPSPAPAPVDDELDSVPEEMYCLWSPGWSAAAAASPSQARCKKSGSTGSVLRWKPRLDVGRSQSDGKEKFVFLSTTAAASPSSSSSGGSSGRRNQKGRGGAVEDAAAAAAGGAGAHAWSCYVDNNKSRTGARRRRSFLPYKQDIVGLFANTAVFRRSYLPF